MDGNTQKRLSGEFAWSTKSRFPGLDKPEKRVPQLFLAVRNRPDDEWVEEVYLVNNSPFTLRTVDCCQGGAATVDIDDPEGYIMQAPLEGVYESVQPREAVFVTDYHRMYDSDYLMQILIKVESEELGTHSFSVLEKGEFSPTPLLWEDGSSKYFWGSDKAK